MARISPATAHYRGKIAALSRCVSAGERQADDQELEEARRGLIEAKATDYIQRLLDAAPPLTQQQRAKLAELLAPVRRTATGSGDLGG